MIDGIGSPPFSAQTLPPLERPHKSCREMVIAASRQHFAKPRDVVEQVVNDLHNPVEPTSTAIDKNNRQFEPPAERERRMANKAAKQAEKNERRAAKRMEQSEAGAEPATSKRANTENGGPSEARAKARASETPQPRDTTNSRASASPAQPARSEHTSGSSESRQRTQTPERPAQVNRANDGRAPEKSKSAKAKTGEQSLADLRSVLATISQQSGGGEKKPDPKPASNSDTFRADTKSSAKPKQSAAPANPAPKAQPTPQPAPAAAIHDAPTRRTDTAAPPKGELSTTTSPLKDALAAAVNDVSFVAPAVAADTAADQKLPAEPATPVRSASTAPEVDASETLPTEAPVTPVDQASEPPLTTPSETVTNPESERAAMAAMAAEADAVWADLEAGSSSVSVSNSPAISKQAVKRILNSGNDRSPFA